MQTIDRTGHTKVEERMFYTPEKVAQSGNEIFKLYRCLRISCKKLENWSHNDAKRL